MERFGTNTQPDRTMEVCMKITKVKTLSGDWWEAEKFTVDDFDITIEGPHRQGRGAHVAYAGSIVIKPRQHILDEVLIAVKSYEELYELFRHTSLNSAYYRGRDELSLIDAIHKYRVERTPTVFARLKNVRREDTHASRCEEARIKAEALLRKDDSRVSVMIEDTIDEVNKGIKRFIDDNHRSVLDRLENSLHSFDAWREHADNNGDFDDLIAEVKDREAVIVGLEAELTEKYNQLKKLRGKSWIDHLEKNNWEWLHSESKIKSKLPDEYIQKTRELVKTGDAFGGCKPRHMRVVFE